MLSKGNRIYMKKYLICLLLPVFLQAQNLEPSGISQKQTYEMSEAELDSLINFTKHHIDDVNKRIQFYAGRALGTPYMLFNLGEGPGSYPDLDPTIDFKHYDCMTFCEQILAMAISKSYSEMYDNLQKIRYKNGTIHFLTRNHYTLADWLPKNHWLLKDIKFLH